LSWPHTVHTGPYAFHAEAVAVVPDLYTIVCESSLSDVHLTRWGATAGRRCRRDMSSSIDLTSC